MKLTKKKLALLLVLAFIFGGIVGSSNKSKEISPEAIESGKVKDLIAVDDKIISYGAETSGLCSASFEALSKGDINTLESIANKVRSNTPKIKELSTERAEILKELGY